jgi:hypothetical protein
MEIVDEPHPAAAILPYGFVTEARVDVRSRSDIFRFAYNNTLLSER